MAAGWPKFSNDDKVQEIEKMIQTMQTDKMDNFNRKILKYDEHEIDQICKN